MMKLKGVRYNGISFDEASTPLRLRITKADQNAVARLLGVKVPKVADNALQWWTDGQWTIELRPDTVNGGTYLYCNCPSWKFGGIRACKHTRFVHENEGV